MPIGTSDGEYFEDETAHAIAAHDARNVAPEEMLYKVGSGLFQGAKELAMGPGKAFKGEMTPEEQYDWGPQMALSMYGANAPFPKPGIGIFGGRVPMKDRFHAEDLEARDVHPETIKFRTGLERGAEGDWRQEINDSGASVNFDLKNFRLHKSTEEGLIHRSTLGEVLNHPEFYKVYPEAKDIQVYTMPKIAGKDTVYGQFNGKAEPASESVINLKKGMTTEEAYSSLMHELQHWVQKKENFSYANVSKFSPKMIDQYRGYIIRNFGRDAMHMVDRLKESGKTEEASNLANQLIQSADYHTYLNMSSEVEARNTERRLGMSPTERRMTLGQSTEDVARQIQLVKRDSSDSAHIGGYSAAESRGPLAEERYLDAQRRPEPDEKIDKVAVRYKLNNQIEADRGVIHAELIDKIANQLKLGDWNYDQFQSGFLTNKGRFVTREQALEIARNQGQLKAETPYTTSWGELDSYDVKGVGRDEPTR